MLLTKTAMRELRKYLPFTRLRFHCRKQRPGRTFHITTAANSKGEAAVQYLSGQTDVQPASCGSYVIMNNDNSRLAKVCKKWGRENGSYYVGKWGHERNEDRPYTLVAFERAAYHWVAGTNGEYQCDDYNNEVSSGDFWKVFVR